MTTEGYTPVGLFPVSDYINEELEARGWTFAIAVRNLDGDPKVNAAWLELLCCRELFTERDNIQFTADDAARLSRIFGIDAGTFTRLHEAFLRSKAAGYN